MNRIAASLLTSVVFLTLSGCGTIMNVHEFTVGPPPEQSAFKPGTYGGAKAVYGGVKFDARHGTDWLRESVEEPPMALAGLYVWIIDLPISAIGDTITLPVTIPAAIDRAIRFHYSLDPAREPNTEPGHSGRSGS
ncbi:YceK/YidQ family lipoprotein [bacterium]|nr:YceK/YidQ family lipoprotein [bacterium]